MDSFVEAFGAPNPSTPNGIHFKNPGLRMLWEGKGGFHQEVGSGWYQDRFYYLFGEGLTDLIPCLDAWSFLVPPTELDRVVVGYNRYGAILFHESALTGRPDSRVKILDPYRVAVGAPNGLDFIGLTGPWLADRRLPDFQDDTLYKEWVAKNGPLPDDEILAPIAPKGLGGAWDLDNVQPERIVEFYQSSAPIYAAAFAKMAAAPAKGT